MLTRRIISTHLVLFSVVISVKSFVFISLQLFFICKPVHYVGCNLINSIVVIIIIIIIIIVKI